MTSESSEDITVRMSRPVLTLLFAISLLLIATGCGGLAWFVYYSLHHSNDPNLAGPYYGLLAAVVAIGLLIYVGRVQYRLRLTSDELTASGLFTKQHIYLSRLASATPRTHTSRTNPVLYYLLCSDEDGNRLKLDLNNFPRSARRKLHDPLLRAFKTADIAIDGDIRTAWDQWFYFMNE